MNTQQINNQLKQLKCFKGTYAKDLLPLKIYKERPLAFVLNTDKSNREGEHWVALFINENNIAEYFDSFARQPLCCEIKQFLKLNKIKTLYYNSQRVQSIFSTSCGLYCILFIKLRCHNFGFIQFLNLFSSEFIKNEVLIENI